MDRLIATLADLQHGILSRQQLLGAGIASHVIDHRLKLSRLHVVHLGIYAVGHRRFTREGRWMAAVLAAGPGAVLSHRAAGSSLGIWHSDRLELTAPTFRVRPGIQIHTSSVPEDEVTTVHGIPVTGISRTLLDLAAVLRPHQLERAMNEVAVQRLTDSLSLLELVARHPRRPGIPTIKQILEADATFTRSELESRFLSFVRETGLPPPATNILLLGFECDCVWRDQHVVVELDGLAAHGTVAAFERDRVRDRTLQAAGWRVIRVTWRQLHDQPAALAADLRTILPARPLPRLARARGGGP